MLPQMSVNYRGFYNTWLMLDDIMNVSTVGSHVCPWIVNGAFSCELGMKYILAYNNCSLKREHLLHILFRQLPEKDQSAILMEIFKCFPDYSGEQVSREIKLLSDAFCSFRYSHEYSLTLNTQFCRAWFTAIFKQVSTYPSYELVERLGEPDITIAELDERIEKTQSEMLSRLEKKGKQRK